LGVVGTAADSRPFRGPARPAGGGRSTGCYPRDAHRRFLGSGLRTNRAEETDPVRVNAAFKRLLDLPGVTVTDVSFQPAKVVVTVKLRSGRLRCPECSFSTRAGYDRRTVASVWRHLDLGHWRLEVRAELRRLTCPVHQVRTEGVPFARAGARFSSDFEDLVGWLATTMDKTALCRLVRIDWASVGRVIERVMATGMDPRRLDKLFSVGVDEVSWRKGHFSGVGDPARCAHRRVGNEGRRHTLWIPCATCKVRATGGQGAGASDCPDRHARLLDGRRRQLAADSGRRRLPAPPPPRCRARGGHHSFLRR